MNYGPVVVAMRNAGVKYFTFTSSYEELVNFQRAMRQQNWKPEVTDLETNFYNKDYPKVGGEAAEGSYVRLTMWPFEEADQNKATRDFLSIMKKYKPNGKIELLGMQAFDAGLLFATAAKTLGDNVTRDRLLSALSKIHEWDGGGLSGVQDPGNNLSGTCQIVMQVHNGGFRRIYPDHGFACPKDGRVTLHGDYGTGAKVSWRRRRRPGEGEQAEVSDFFAFTVLGLSAGRSTPLPPAASSSPTRPRASSTSPKVRSACSPRSATGSSAMRGDGLRPSRSSSCSWWLLRCRVR